MARSLAGWWSYCESSDEATPTRARYADLQAQTTFEIVGVDLDGGIVLRWDPPFGPPRRASQAASIPQNPDLRCCPRHMRWSANLLSARERHPDSAADIGQGCSCR